MKISKGINELRHLLNCTHYVIAKAKGTLTFGNIIVIILVQLLYLLKYIFLALLPWVNSTIVESAIEITAGNQSQYIMLIISISIILLYALYNFFSGSILAVLSKSVLKELCKKTYGEFLEKISKVKYVYYNNPKLYESIIIIKDNINRILNDVFVSGMFVSIIGLLTVIIYTFVVLCHVSLVIGVILLIANCVTVISSYLQTTKDFYAEVDQLREKRWSDTYANLITSPSVEKEIRLNSSFNYILDRWSLVEKKRKKKSIKLLVEYSCIDIVIAIVKYLLLGISLIITISCIIDGTASVDALVLVYASHTVLDGKLTEFFGSIIKLKSLSFYVDKWREIDILQDECNGNKEIPNHFNDGYEITFESITYHYENTTTNAVDDVSFTIKAGEKVGIVGENGSGKTTIIHLLLGLLAPDSGSIRINGQENYDVMTQFRDNISVMFQDFCCYDLSIRDNVQLGDIHNIKSDDELQDIIINADLNTLVGGLKNGLDTKLGSIWDNGVDFSGGERQRIALSRLYSRSNPKLIIMDEPTSALDPLAETNLYNRIIEDFSQKGMIMVSHRLGFMNHMDKIIVMNKGKILDIGNHAELMIRCESYKEMYSSFLELYKFNNR